MRPSTAISFLLAAFFGACSKPNPDHCANQDGHMTCQDRGGDTRYCSKCVADNNGCVAEPVADECDAGSTSEPAGSTSDPSTGDSPTSSTSSTSSTGGTSSTSSTSDPTTSDPSTTSTTDLTTSSTGTTTLSSTGTTLETMGTTLETTGTTDATDTQSTETPGTTGDTGDATDATDDSTTGPMCGNNVQEPGETCDGTDLNGLELCTQKNPLKYGGGTLSCAANCNSYVESNCCVADSQSGCQLNGPLCCSGTCVLGTCN